MKVFKNIILTLLSVVAILSICTFLFLNFCCSKVVVNGTSMNPTLQNGELGFFIKNDNIFSNIKRNDIIIFDGELEDKNELLIKRVIGLPGDKIEIKLNGKIFVNDEELSQDYISEDTQKLTFQPLSLFMKVELKEDEYFVLGDNRLVSFDSRLFGPIKESQLKGEYKLSYGKFNNYNSNTGEGGDKTIFPIKFFEETLWNF